MSSNDSTAKGWTDRQRLAYYFSLVEYSNVKLDFTNAPRPEGKSVGACRIMVDRLKGTLKDELAALRGADADAGGTTPKKAVTTARKRKAEDGTPVKQGRKKKVEDVEEEEEKVVGDKNEVKEEDIDGVV
ncbi:hypothetical protein COCCADRAFT_7333 [Bipolaris zeicola 26-R-13]|uniref:Uncharacterized protein n=1 Tax=Cochliobolus carbonum (strain 26-R-13) TaxID=930089 RepID=W6YH67_COCC2|nr:uncharacterized protein COCCADRAFT_7333 [Bipolaris zeicola 26-R-13]EUC30661.1 hypothetical protein COCCADRAFT_7333 [Bipolaris zeicola 26-R-13]